MNSRIDTLPELERLRLVGMIADGVSWRRLAQEFGMSHNAIRNWAIEQGMCRNPTGAKKGMVDALLLRDDDAPEQCSDPAITTGNAYVDAAANRDAKVVRLSANVALGVINRVAKLLQNSESDAKECLIMATANDRAIGTYSRILKLDDAPKEKITIRWSDSE